MEVEKVEILVSWGECLPKSLEPDEYLKILAEPAQIENGKALMDHVKKATTAAGHGNACVGTMQVQAAGERLAWMLLEESSQNIPRIANKVVIFSVWSSPASDFERGAKRRRQDVVPFQRLPPASQNYPFKGRSLLMTRVARLIEDYVTFAYTGNLVRDRMLFLTFEGLAGVGKTRCLLEIMNEVKKVIKGDCALSKLYDEKAVQAIYMSFSGSAVNSRASDKITAHFVSMAKGTQSEGGGRLFMQVCIMSHVLYQKPFYQLDDETQQMILEVDFEAGMQKVVLHIRESLGLSGETNVALYVLIDEVQILAEKMSSDYDIPNASVLAFFTDMFDILGEFMVKDAGETASQKCRLILIPVLGGTILPVIGKYGITSWNKECCMLPPLDEASAEGLSADVLKNHAITVHPLFKRVLHDCSYVPRLLTHAYFSIERSIAGRLSEEEMLREVQLYLKSKMASQAQLVLIYGNESRIKTMVRLCLTKLENASSFLEPDFANKELKRGYVALDEARATYYIPKYLLFSLCQQLKIHPHLSNLNPGDLKDQNLEQAFLDMLHCRMCLFADQEVRLSSIYRGAVGKREVLETMVKLGKEEEIEFDEEKVAFIDNETKKFAFGENCMARAKRGIINLPGKNKVLKTANYNFLVDGRQLLSCSNGRYLEVWLQMKGHKDKLSKKEFSKIIKEASTLSEQVRDREILFVVVSTWRVPEMDVPHQVLVYDLAGLQAFMPWFLDRGF